MNALLSSYLLSSLSYRNSHQSLSSSIRYGTLFRNQKLTRKQRLVISSMSVHQFSESKAFMHQLTHIFCNIKVEVAALSSYEEKEELFKEQVDWTYMYSIFFSLQCIPFPSLLYWMQLHLL